MSSPTGKSVRSPVIRDRGPAKHFHGRAEPLKKFGEAMDAAQAGYGTIFLIQGAPGVGKTALLAECRRVAEEAGWQTARINPIALWDTNTLLKALGHAPDPDQKESTWGTNVEGKAGIPTLGEAAGSGSFESKKNTCGTNPTGCIK